MQSYRKGLESRAAYGESVSLTRKPIFRSSTIFPIIESSYISTKITFLSYWMIKRNIKEIGILFTLRDESGTIFCRQKMNINKAKAFQIDIIDVLETINFNNSKDFIGSIEIEVFSTQDMFFPYPAFCVVYHGEDFSSSVHSLGRIYNDFDDLLENTSVSIPETGFDVCSGKGFEPFFSFTNGAVENPNGIVKYRIVGSTEITEGSFELGILKSFETRFVMLKDHIDLEKILGGRKGAISLEHNFQGFFPRFLCGNFENNRKSLSVTHSFYDSTSIDTDDAYIDKPPENLYHSSKLLPFFGKSDNYTKLILYPCSSPSSFNLNLHYFDNAGLQIGNITVGKNIKNTKSLYEEFDFAEIAGINGISIDDIASVKFISEFTDKIPTRLKMGLNIGVKGKHNQLPCNICFAPDVADEKKLTKPSTFRWLPFINKGNSIVVITNSGTEKKYDRTAQVKISFFRSQDDKYLIRDISIGPNKIHQILLDSDDELKNFLGNDIGWISVLADNGFVESWYFDICKSGSVAADHGF